MHNRKGENLETESSEYYLQCTNAAGSGNGYKQQEQQENPLKGWIAIPGKHRVTDINAQADIERKTWCFFFYTTFAALYFQSNYIWKHYFRALPLHFFKK